MVCCDPCWERAPRDLPSYPDWRAQWSAAQKDGDWNTVDAIHAALVEWVRDNQVEPRGSHGHRR
jgi:hypothetical protein